MTDRWQPSSERRNAGAGTPEAPIVSGVVETIAAGMSLAFWRPRLLVIPVVIDLLLWLGLQVSANPLTAPLGRLMEREGGENGELAAEQLAEFGARAHVNDLVAWLIPSLFAGVPSDTVLTALLSFLVPPLMDGVDREGMYDQWGDGLLNLWQPDNWFVVVSVGLAFLLLGSVVLVLFRVPLAFSVRGGRASARRLAGDLAMAWLRVVGLISLVGLVAAVAVGPLVVLAAVLLLLGLDVSSLLALILICVGGLVAIYTVFTVDAIVLSQVGPLHGLRQSFQVVRANFGPTVRFAISSLLIGTGSFQLWEALVANPPGIVLSLIGNSFIGTGLILASMMFFYDRFRLLQRTPPPAGRGRP